MSDLELWIDIVEKAWETYRSHSPQNDRRFVDFPLLENERQRIYEKTEIDVSGYQRTFTAEAVTHILDKHGSNTHGRIGVTKHMLLRLPVIFKNAEVIGLGRPEQKGVQTIVYRIEMDMDTEAYIELIDTVNHGKKRRKLSVKTMYVVKRKKWWD